MNTHMKYPEMEEAHGKGCSGVAVETRRWRAEAAEGSDGSPKRIGGGRMERCCWGEVLMARGCMRGSGVLRLEEDLHRAGHGGAVRMRPTKREIRQQRACCLGCREGRHEEGTAMNLVEGR